MIEVAYRRIMTLPVLAVFTVMILVCEAGASQHDQGAASASGGAGQSAQKQAPPKGKISLTRMAPILTPVSDYTGTLLERSTVTGDWWGRRQQLYELGITFDAALTQVFQNVVDGGTDTGDSAYTGLLDTGLTLDTGKLGLWSGGLFVFNGQTGFASDFPLEAGTISPSNFTSIYPTLDKPDAFLMEYYLMQALSEDFVLIIGRVNAVSFLDRNRFANDPRNQFLNISLGNDPSYGSFISFSTLGALASWKITKHFTISPAIFDPNLQPGDWVEPDERDLFEDVGLAAEADLTWKLSDSLDGTARVIGIYVNKDAVAFDNPWLVPVGKIRVNPSTDLVFLRPALDTKSDNWIVAFNFEQYVWKPHVSADKAKTARTAAFDFQEPGLGVFGRFSYTPEDRNAWNIYASGGIGGRGIIPGRLYDRVGIGLYWMKESGDLDDLPGNVLQDEVGFEAFYNLAVTPAAQLTFDIQWVDSGVKAVDDTVVFGLRLFTQF